MRISNNIQGMENDICSSLFDDYTEQINFFKNFMDITELKLDKNVGPGVARQYGIDNLYYRSLKLFVRFLNTKNQL